MALTNGLGIIDKTIEALITGVVGSPQAVGLIFITMLFIFGVMLRLPMILILILLIPINAVLIAFGYLYGIVGAIHILLILFVLGFNFLKQKQ